MRILDDRLLIFFTADISLSFPTWPMCTSPLPLFFKVMHSQTRTHTYTHIETISISLLSTLYHCAAWGAVLADLHWLLRAIPFFLAPCGRREKKSKLSHSSNQHLPESSPRELPLFSCHFLFKLSLSVYDIFYVISLTNNSCARNSQEGIVISYLSVVPYTRKLLWTCVFCRSQ